MSGLLLTPTNVVAIDCESCGFIKLYQICGKLLQIFIGGCRIKEMKRKTCIICKAKLKPIQHIFCGNDCYLSGIEITKKESAYLQQQKEVIKKHRELVELETEVLYAKKQNLILKESVNFDVPFIRIQEERYTRKPSNVGVVLPEDSDVIPV